jgi:hypothetical protein
VAAGIILRRGLNSKLLNRGAEVLFHVFTTSEIV